jgi:MFS family permease
MTQGIFQSVFPIFSHDVVGLSEYDIGSLMTAAGILSLVVSFPNGWLVDHFGRRAALTPGLLVLGLSVSLMAISTSYWPVVLAIAVYGIGEGMGNGSSQAAAMDLAPDQNRGAFLGVWSLLQNGGAVIAATAIGAAADTLGYPTTFQTTAVVMAVSAALFWIAGAGIGGRKPVPAPASAERAPVVTPSSPAAQGGG